MLGEVSYGRKKMNSLDNLRVNLDVEEELPYQFYRYNKIDTMIVDFLKRVLPNLSEKGVRIEISTNLDNLEYTFSVVFLNENGAIPVTISRKIRIDDLDKTYFEILGKVLKEIVEECKPFEFLEGVAK